MLIYRRLVAVSVGIPLLKVQDFLVEKSLAHLVVSAILCTPMKLSSGRVNLFLGVLWAAWG